MLHLIWTAPFMCMCDCATVRLSHIISRWLISFYSTAPCKWKENMRERKPNYADKNKLNLSTVDVDAHNHNEWGGKRMFFTLFPLCLRHWPRPLPPLLGGHTYTT